MRMRALKRLYVSEYVGRDYLRTPRDICLETTPEISRLWRIVIFGMDRGIIVRIRVQYVYTGDNGDDDDRRAEHSQCYEVRACAIA